MASKDALRKVAVIGFAPSAATGYGAGYYHATGTVTGSLKNAAIALVACLGAVLVWEVIEGARRSGWS